MRGRKGDQDAKSDVRDTARMKRNLYVILPIALYVLLRVPSFIEPQWYTDEAGYASTIWLTHLGYGLYVDAWNNKPPLLFGIYYLSGTLFGTSEAGLHALAMLSGLTAVVAAVVGMSRIFSKRAALWAGLVIAVIVGSPMLDANLALPESLLIGPVTVAVMWFLCSCTDPAARRPRALTLVSIGVLLACAFLIQQTALADCASIVLWCLVRRNWRTIVILGSAFTVTSGAVIVPFLISAGVHNVWYALVSSYVDYVDDALRDQLPSYLLRIGIVLAMVAAAWFYRRAKDGRVELIRVWATALLFAAIAAGYSYEHFLLPVVIPLVLLVTGLVSRHHDQLSRRIRRPAMLLATATFAVIAATGWTLYVAAYKTTVWSFGYYPNAVGYVTGAVSVLDYDTYFGPLSYGENQAEQWIASHNMVGATAMLWTNLAWPLVDDELVPPTRSGPLYVTLELENGTAALLSKMNAAPPELILVTPVGIQRLGDILAFIQGHAYQQVMNANGVELYVRSDP